MRVKLCKEISSLSHDPWVSKGNLFYTEKLTEKSFELNGIYIP